MYRTLNNFLDRFFSVPTDISQSSIDDNSDLKQTDKPTKLLYAYALYTHFEYLSLLAQGSVSVRSILNEHTGEYVNRLCSLSGINESDLFDYFNIPLEVITPGVLDQPLIAG